MQTQQPDLSNVQEELDHLRRLKRISEEIDALIEQCMVSQKCLSATVDEVFTYVAQELNPRAQVLRSFDEQLLLTTYTRDTTSELLKTLEENLLSTTGHAQAMIGDQAWYALSLDMAGESVGVFALGWPKDQIQNPARTFALMNVIVEELDSLFYAIRANRMKHMTILEIQRCLKEKNLLSAIDQAVNVLGDAVPFDDLLLLYLDEDLEGKKSIQYSFYRSCRKAFDSQDKPMPELEALIREGKEIVIPGNRDLQKIIEIDEATETVLIDGVVVETLVGKLIVKPPLGIGLSISSREILQVFAESLRQRLVDFNREKNLLRQYFSPTVTRRLLEIPDYKNQYLLPRKADIGILFADVSGFTKLSEQVLGEPERIARFIDQWASGVVECLFEQDGCLDKLVGDCVIGLFGPPFFNGESSLLGLQALKSAVSIREFTKHFLELEANRDIQNSEYYKDFGVAIGVNLCSADVGMIGPNKDLTAFSSGMNNTARLQGLAHAGEILITPSVKESAERHEPGKWRFSGPYTAKVKNVAAPLSYFKLES